LWAIHVKNYVLKVNTIGEVVLEHITSSNLCVIRIYRSLVSHKDQQHIQEARLIGTGDRDI
jgi:hypothetical protein